MNATHAERAAKPDDARLALCPKGFVPRGGFGNCRTCATCDRPYEQHAVVEQ